MTTNYKIIPINRKALIRPSRRLHRDLSKAGLVNQNRPTHVSEATVRNHLRAFLRLTDRRIVRAEPVDRADYDQVRAHSLLEANDLGVLIGGDIVADPECRLLGDGLGVISIVGIYVYGPKDDFVPYDDMPASDYVRVMGDSYGLKANAKAAMDAGEPVSEPTFANINYAGVRRVMVDGETVWRNKHFYPGQKLHGYRGRGNVTLEMTNAEGIESLVRNILEVSLGFKEKSAHVFQHLFA